MPFYRPTREQIRRRVQSDFRNAFGNDAVLYEGTIEYAFCEALVGLSHAQHGRLDQIYRDAFPHLASEQGVVNWARFYNVFRNKATYAEGLVGLAGVIGSELPKGSVVARDADAFEYRTLEDWVIDGGANLVSVRARKPGAAGNCDAATTMRFQEPTEGVLSETQSYEAFGGGADAETIPAMRTRLLEILAEPAGGGKIGDYVRWAKMVTGVTRAWEYGNVPKVGDVTVLFMRDLDTDPFPGAPALADVLEMLTLYAPIALPTPTVQSPIDHPLVLEIELTIEDDAVLADVRAAIVVSIQEMLATRASPPAEDGGVLYRSWITEAISTTVGEKDHKLITPALDVDLSQWEIPTLNDPDAQITWV